MTPKLIELIEQCQQGADLLDSSMRQLYCEMIRENPLAAQLFVSTGLKMASDLDNLMEALNSIIPEVGE